MGGNIKMTYNILHKMAVAASVALGACGGVQEKETTMSQMEFVDIQTVDSSILLDIRYATSNNFTGKVVYPVAKCYLRTNVAERLARVQQDLKQEGLGLKVFDCYRPFSIQQKFWAIVPNEDYVAKPVADAQGKLVQGSKHNRGAAVDLTLVDRVGQEVEMPTGYDDFTEKAHRSYQGNTVMAQKNMKKLEDVMTKHGFEPLPSEWWHFDGPGWQKYALSDFPIK